MSPHLHCAGDPGPGTSPQAAQPQPPSSSFPDPAAVLPAGLDLSELSNLAALLGVAGVNLPAEASVQERERAVADAVVVEAAHKQQEQAPADSRGFQGDVNAAAATFLQGLLGETSSPSGFEWLHKCV